MSINLDQLAQGSSEERLKVLSGQKPKRLTKIKEEAERKLKNLKLGIAGEAPPETESSSAAESQPDLTATPDFQQALHTTIQGFAGLLRDVDEIIDSRTEGNGSDS
ncbi:hypothetical protein KKF55_06470 [Patescibacteria group bacterium]|nr:hypothetical protein [Patescibacteria group bacterium]